MLLYLEAWFHFNFFLLIRFLNRGVLLLGCRWCLVIYLFFYVMLLTFPYFLAGKSNHVIQFWPMTCKVKSAGLRWGVLQEKIDREMSKGRLFLFPPSLNMLCEFIIWIWGSHLVAMRLQAWGWKCLLRMTESEEGVSRLLTVFLWKIKCIYLSTIGQGFSY